MFTSEPSLTQRIGRMIADTSIIDSHTHIRGDQPGAPDLAALMSDPHLLADLAAVGRPAADLDPTLPADERVRRALPYLKPIRNTATAWCLYRIFRDLYDFDEPHLDLTNYRPLFDKVAASAQEPDWARSTLVDRARIIRFVTDSAWTQAGTSGLADRASYSADLGAAPELAESAAGSSRFSSIPLPSGLDGSMISDRIRSIFRRHHDQGLLLRLTAPTDAPAWSGASTIGNLAGLLDDCPDARFNLLLDQVIDPRAMTALAGRLPNVTVSGTAWRNASALSVAETLGHRVQGAPATKVIGFTSDACSVEWSYGRLQLSKKAMGSAFGRLIEDGFFEEDEIPPLIRQILHDSPLEILGLESN